MKRAIVLAISVILALTMAAPTVLARSVNGVAPEDVNPDSEPIIINAGDVPGSCAFDMRLDLSGKAKTIVLPDGAVVGVTSIGTSPGLDVTVTNFTNEVRGESLTFNITGSIFRTPRPDGSGIVDYVITGRNLALDPAGLFLNKGRFTFTLDESDPENIRIVTPQEGKGQAIDVCALLS